MTVEARVLEIANHVDKVGFCFLRQSGFGDSFVSRDVISTLKDSEDWE